MIEADRGSASVVAAAVVALSLTLAVALGAVGVVLEARMRAVNAADAAALAAAPATFSPLGLGDPARRAAETAADNGGTLKSCVCRVDPTWSPRTATVTIEVIADVPVLGPTSIEAVSRAEFRPVALTGH